ncbi:hypothetical protein C8J56DRAFT_917838 [Mycena floridula]|nr:hypothetical protein C8J56DRAFT_917838 [Mycena floridula]
MNETVSIQRIANFQDPRTNEARSVREACFSQGLFEALDRNHGLQQIFLDMTLRATLSTAHLMVAVDNTTGKVVGTAAWYPPGSEMFADERQRKEARLEEFFAAISKARPALSNWWKTVFFPALANDAGRFLGPDTKLENWNLYSLAVLEMYRGRGIASKLMKYAEDQAALTGHSVILEASGEPNLSIYKSLGYTVAGTAEIQGPPGHKNFPQSVLVKYPKLSI